MVGGVDTLRMGVWTMRKMGFYLEIFIKYLGTYSRRALTRESVLNIINTLYGIWLSILPSEEELFSDLGLHISELEVIT